ncbi:DnaJ domain-containing protein [Phytoactinopolyspora endophytica]|uniref:DnaJ domain-containing protein n=1 Tax=Phytoactinopolyspora endophytica TaxID=1642495 RepID=UPI0013EAD663|nr:DnaJ domain-containing protein [Phytoactinopolyspora endophytica]
MTVTKDIEELGGRDPHAVLGVQRGVSQHEVSRAFRRNAASGGHPDSDGDDRRFRQLTRARDILLDTDRLAAYDAAQRATRIAHSPNYSVRERHRAPEGAHHDRQPSQREPSRDDDPRVAQPEPPQSHGSPQPKMNALAIGTLVLAALGPLLWPVAILMGHLALRQMKRSGQRGDSLVHVTLALLYVLCILVLPRLLLFLVPA